MCSVTTMCLHVFTEISGVELNLVSFDQLLKLSYQQLCGIFFSFLHKAYQVTINDLCGYHNKTVLCSEYFCPELLYTV